jgi:hypothetical protein
MALQNLGYRHLGVTGYTERVSPSYRYRMGSRQRHKGAEAPGMESNPDDEFGNTRASLVRVRFGHFSWRPRVRVPVRAHRSSSNLTPVNRGIAEHRLPASRLAAAEQGKMRWIQLTGSFECTARS